jgi:hypothetical protein
MFCAGVEIPVTKQAVYRNAGINPYSIMTNCALASGLKFTVMFDV